MKGAYDKKCEFRASSIKGCLRYWFRVIYSGRLEEESRLFGSTASRSPLIVRASELSIKEGNVDYDKGKSGIAYLGYGIIDRKKKLSQQLCYQPESTFTLEFGFNRSLSHEDKIKILNAFWALLMFGGLGARSRRGFGSMVVDTVDDEIKLLRDLPSFQYRDDQSLEKAVVTFIGQLRIDNDPVNHTAFSKQMRLLIYPEQGHPLKLLEKIGNNFMNFRKESFHDDSHVMFEFIKSDVKPKNSPERASFGLPHQYFFKDSNSKGSVNYFCGNTEARRASPLFLHIQGLTDNLACGVFLFLPTKGLIPDGKKLTMSKEGDKKTKEVDPPDFSGVNKYLNYLVDIGWKEISI
ncbi:MAG: CRISPR-associated RAMP Cmr1 family protein [Candidatus Magnetoglobus multicellularis str. Araruama]|uniref:CRISPR-associated RAMP Cmr1 family protein n=1 Tax=Candidatus Magnetoglobus multicellularis str. Araruama TaxID=890399 RepID=A0A1V1PFZ6_9BACT|nr:MAG: CRISPR-associated RAMP Cmr1 family protein [Candidatus Magnetoglobus multicellularis str. Araruama]